VSRHAITLIAPDGSNSVELTDGDEPAWSPDGSTLYYSRDAQIYRIPAAGGAPQLVANTLGGRTPAVSPDGRWLAFSRTLSDSIKTDIWILDLNTP
jgi:Tol biopolymer transport system component